MTEPEDEPGGFSPIGTGASLDPAVEMAALRESESRFRRIFEQSAVGIAEVGLDGSFLLVNDTFCEITGHSRSSLRKMRFQEITHPADRHNDQEIGNELLSGHMPRCTLEKRYLRPDRSEVWVRLTVSAPRKEEGALGSFVCFVEDIQEKKRTEAALRESEERFAAFMARSPAAAWIVDRSGRIRYASPTYFRMFDAKEEEFVGRRLDEAYPRALAEEYLANNETVLRSHQTVEVLESGLRRGGEAGKFLSFKFPIHGGDGDLMVGGLALDVTKHLQNELALQKALEAAESASRAKSFFLANMSHEIRTPLNAIVGFSELLKHSEIPTQKRDEFLDIVIKNGWHLTSLIGDLLDIAKIEADRAIVENAPVSVRETLDDVCRMLTPTAQSGQVELRCEVLPAVPDRIISDPTRLKQILSNVMGNAVKFTPAGGTVQVSVQASAGNDRIEFHVTDSGIGIAQEEHERIFDAFHQAETTLRKSKGGTGLGLTLSRKLSRLLGGDLVLARSAPEAGSTFVFSIATVPERSGATAKGSKYVPVEEELLAH